MDDLTSTTLLYGGNAAFVEELYEQFLADPGSVDPAWRTYFSGIAAGARDVAHGPVRARLAAAARAPAVAHPAAAPTDDRAAKQGAVSRLIQVYANRGHLIANLDPLGLQSAPRPYVL